MHTRSHFEQDLEDTGTRRYKERRRSFRIEVNTIESGILPLPPRPWSSASGSQHTHFVRSVILVDAGFTVDACGVLLTVHAHPSSTVLPGGVHASLLLRHVLVVVTVFGFIVTVAF